MNRKEAAEDLKDLQQHFAFLLRKDNRMIDKEQAKRDYEVIGVALECIGIVEKMREGWRKRLIDTEIESLSM